MVSVPWYTLCLFLGSAAPDTLLQEMAGVGVPLALQGKVTFSPTLLKYSSSGLSLMVGGSLTWTCMIPLVPLVP